MRNVRHPDRGSAHIHEISNCLRNTRIMYEIREMFKKYAKYLRNTRNIYEICEIYTKYCENMRNVRHPDRGSFVQELILHSQQDIMFLLRLQLLSVPHLNIN